MALIFVTFGGQQKRHFCYFLRRRRRGERAPSKEARAHLETTRVTAFSSLGVERNNLQKLSEKTISRVKKLRRQSWKLNWHWQERCTLTKLSVPYTLPERRRYENPRPINQTPIAARRWQMGTLHCLRRTITTRLAKKWGKSEGKDRAICQRTGISLGILQTRTLRHFRERDEARVILSSQF